MLLEATVAAPVLVEDPELLVADRRADGSVVVALDVRSIAGLRSFVLSHLDHAELLDPPDLRQGLVDWLTPFVGDAAGGAAT